MTRIFEVYRVGDQTLRASSRGRARVEPSETLTRAALATKLNSSPSARRRKLTLALAKRGRRRRCTASTRSGIAAGKSASLRHLFQNFGKFLEAFSFNEISTPFVVMFPLPCRPASCSMGRPQPGHAGAGPFPSSSVQRRPGCRLSSKARNPPAVSAEQLQTTAATCRQT